MKGLILYAYIYEYSKIDSQKQILKQLLLANSGKDEEHWLLMTWNAFLKAQKCSKVQLWMSVVHCYSYTKKKKYS